ncbi:hypothetical protein N0V82_005179 [Gnomoniopsis sp. IMI 355080]|nr:hypothetical protein N0V82_005179 [Gnomoniopsis sp. IMI 355080]
MKDNKEVISEFNEYVNMTASELEKWLKSDDSTSAGWSKDGGDGESVGHDSGRKIVEILKSNPDKTPDKYTDDQLQHMRKVASYCKRHLAQEASGNSDKDPEEVKKTKSYISLKNWGHDFLKEKGKQSGSANGGSKSGSKKKEEDKEEDDQKEEDDGAEDEAEQEKEEEEEEGDEDEGEGDKDKKAGDKRKKSGQQNGSNKKQETRKTRSSDKKESESDDKEEAEDDQNGKDDGGDEGENGDSGGKSGKNGPKKGETVSWNWGSGNPKGKVLDVKEDKATITTKNGNEVSRDGDSEDPAVVLDTGKSKAIKSAHELN